MNNTLLQLVETPNLKQVTIPQLYQIVGEQRCAKWQALGDMDSKVHWAYGAEAAELIDEGFAAMTVYKAIGIKAGRSSETIRKAYYTFKSFTAATREKYNLCPYSVFDHARHCDNPISVLEHYVSNQSSVDEIELVFQPADGDAEFESDFNRTGYPRIFYGIYREIYGLAPNIRKQVETRLQEINEIIRKANE